MCLCLTYFTQYDNLEVHPCCCKLHYVALSNGEYSMVYRVSSLQTNVFGSKIEFLSPVDSRVQQSASVPLTESAIQHCTVTGLWCGPFSKKSFLNSLQFCFWFWFVGLQARGILASRSGTEPAPTPGIGRRNLNRWATREVLHGIGF